MRHTSTICALLMLSNPLAAAEIYRCERDGRAVFTDVPCGTEAEPLILKAPTTIQAGANADLARRYDERLARERGDRDRADAQWLKTHAEAKARDERLRRALLEGRVIKGMSPAQVRQVWGEPTQIQIKEQNERWLYRENKLKRTVSFRDGEVGTVSGAAGPAASKP